MLEFSRNVGEAITIGDDTSVQIIGVKGNEVRIRVNVPPDVAVHSEEEYKKIQVKTVDDCSSPPPLAQVANGCINILLRDWDT